MTSIIDCGLGNPGSVLNMIRRIGGSGVLTSSPDDVRRASKVVLPGVGSFDAGMAALQHAGLDEALADAAASGAWVLGICLGMQLLLERSEEGTSAGLGLVPGRVHRFEVGEQGLKVPHMGWDTVTAARPSVLLEDANAEEQRFYFVHSYFAECDNESDVVGVTTYGLPFVSAFEHERILGVQFHPEKSHRFGMALMKRFLEV